MIKKLSKANKIWTRVFDGKHEYVIVSNEMRTQYTIYRVEKEGDVICGYEKLGSGNNPFDLEDKLIWKVGKKKK